VTVAAIPAVGDVCEPLHLARGQRAVGNGDPEHVGVKLEIEAVHQPKRAELVLAELAGEAPFSLVAELPGAVENELAVEFVVAVHRFTPRP
jgi:hypothetical protein